MVRTSQRRKRAPHEICVYIRSVGYDARLIDQCENITYKVVNLLNCSSLFDQMYVIIMSHHAIPNITESVEELTLISCCDLKYDFALF